MSIGQVLEGKYRVNAILGQGGMGVVAECTHLALNERVALKMLRQDVMLDHDAVQRFIREAQAAVKLKSEYVARVSDVGAFASGVPYMVMEFLEGYDLGQLLEQRGTLPVQWSVELMLQTCEALAEAHSLGIVHRDVKPTNLFVTWRPDGSALIKVLDFGISKSPMGTDIQLTQTQSMLGTPAYMSPEQMRSARLVDSRTDIWSLGTVFYEILEGHRPFEAESFSEMCVKVAVDSPAPMVKTPPELQPVILRCLAKQPEQRYTHMAELGRDLIAFAPDPHAAQGLVSRMVRMLRRGGVDVDTNGAAWHSNTPWHANTPTSGTVPSQPSQPSMPAVSAATTQDEGGRRKRRWLVPLALLVGFAGAAVGVGMVVSRRGGDKPVQAVEQKAEQPAGSQVDTQPVEVAKPVETPKQEPPKVETPPKTPTVEAAKVEPKVTASASAVKKRGTGKAVAKVKKEAEKPEVKKPEVKTTPPPPSRPCDPFDAMHGCNK